MPTFINKPTAFITWGDPSGIGPEIVLKALRSPRLRSIRPIVIIGSGVILKKIERLTGISLPRDASFIDLHNVEERGFRFGTISPAYGKASFEYVREAIRLLQKGKNGYLVTAPLQKESLQKEGFSWPGHTEMLKDLTHSKKVNMMFVGKHFRISLVTWHIGMKEISSALSKGKVLDAILFLHQALERYFAKNRPHLALCALNPHAGEGGLFGDEEKRILLPACRIAQGRGIDIEGPLPADALFYQAYRKGYDGIVALYHDQGLIPFKMVERDTGVNVTLGLPFVRTSPDHGTAFDIAGKNRADPHSMIEAILLGHEMAQRGQFRKVG